MFAHVLRLADEMGVLKIGTVSMDGTHIKANASKHKSVRYDRAAELEAKLEADIEELLRQAEEAEHTQAERDERDDEKPSEGEASADPRSEQQINLTD